MESERGGGDTLNGGMEIGVGVNDDGILSTHLKDRALNPYLAGSAISSDFVDVQTDFA